MSIMDKQHILDEIRRTATANGGVPFGRARFQDAAGIKQSDWYGKYWRSWGETVTEAGYTANELQKALDDDHIIGKLVELIQELRRFPVAADLRMKARADPEFPSHNVFERVGGKARPIALRKQSITAAIAMGWKRWRKSASRLLCSAGMAPWIPIAMSGLSVSST